MVIKIKDKLYVVEKPNEQPKDYNKVTDEVFINNDGSYIPDLKNFIIEYSPIQVGDTREVECGDCDGGFIHILGGRKALIKME